MKLEYYVIYNPKHGYYLGKKPVNGSFRYGERYVFGYSLPPTLYKRAASAAAALDVLPDKAKAGAFVVSCVVELPYDQPVEKYDLFNEEGVSALG